MCRSVVQSAPVVPIALSSVTADVQSAIMRLRIFSRNVRITRRELIDSVMVCSGTFRRTPWAAISLWLLLGLLPFALTACGASDPTNDAPAKGANASAAAAIPPTSSGTPIILLFTGRGTSPNDVAALERILSENHFSYSTASSPQLNGMSEPELRAYRLLMVPGGNFEEIGHGLTSSATARLRNAIRSGLSYVGMCAGAFFAGNSPYNGLNLTSGVRFTFYAAENRGIRKAAVAVAAAGSPTLDHYWEDGPQLTGWGDVVAKYPDGTPAIVEGTFGDGWVILSGIHPEAPESWRRGMTFTTPASVDNTYAATLIDAAVTRRWLAHY
jgi:glutamine amidotransferase-like uncharacterized protein